MKIYFAKLVFLARERARVFDNKVSRFWVDVFAFFIKCLLPTYSLQTETDARAIFKWNTMYVVKVIQLHCTSTTTTTISENVLLIPLLDSIFSLNLLCEWSPFFWQNINKEGARDIWKFLVMGERRENLFCVLWIMNVRIVNFPLSFSKKITKL